jgi:hypothetical protein
MRAFANTSPVFSRGWILQERILAPRVLHFAAESLVWECCEGRATRFSPRLLHRLVPYKSLDPYAGSITSSKHSEPGLVSMWFRALLTYSRSKLTEPNKDKLVAFQGISRAVADSIGETLLHGFLPSTIPYALCWYAACHPLGKPSCDPGENNSVASWHYSRSNHVYGLLYPDTDRSMPLIHVMHELCNLQRLCCLARVIPLQVKWELDRSSMPAIVAQIELGLVCSESRLPSGRSLLCRQGRE